MGEQPKKPASAIALFAASEKCSVGKATSRWSELPSDQQKKWETEHQRLLVEYDKDLASFQKSNASYKLLERAAKPAARKGKSAKPKRGARIKPPAGAPGKALNAFQCFVAAQKEKRPADANKKIWESL